MLRQRLLGIAAGYCDLNDHTQLRQDMALQTSVESLQILASCSTLCRFEAQMDRQSILDATDIPLHGDQPEKFFHGYYDHYCYLPLYVFCNRFPLVAYLRPCNIDGTKHTAAILKLLVTFIRQHWPDVQIVFRGDSGFCRQLVLNWCDRNGVWQI